MNKRYTYVDYQNAARVCDQESNTVYELEFAIIIFTKLFRDDDPSFDTKKFEKACYREFNYTK